MFIIILDYGSIGTSMLFIAVKCSQRRPPLTPRGKKKKWAVLFFMSLLNVQIRILHQLNFQFQFSWLIHWAMFISATLFLSCVSCAMQSVVWKPKGGRHSPASCKEALMMPGSGSGISHSQAAGQVPNHFFSSSPADTCGSKDSIQRLKLRISARSRKP